jgi:hypothetical protein
MKAEERRAKAKQKIELLIQDTWSEYHISEVEFLYQLKRARADKRRAGKFSKINTVEELKDVYLCTYTHYKNETDCVKTTLTLYTALSLTVEQLTAAYCFNDASLNWTNQEFKENILSI